jgi:hypothetical protein
VQDVGSDGLDISEDIAIRLVPQTAGFKAIEDFFGEASASARFTRHWKTDLRLVCSGTACTARLTLGKWRRYE